MRVTIPTVSGQEGNVDIFDGARPEGEGFYCVARDVAPNDVTSFWVHYVLPQYYGKLPNITEATPELEADLQKRLETRYVPLYGPIVSYRVSKNVYREPIIRHVQFENGSKAMFYLDYDMKRKPVWKRKDGNIFETCLYKG